MKWDEFFKTNFARRYYDSMKGNVITRGFIRSFTRLGTTEFSGEGAIVARYYGSTRTWEVCEGIHLFTGFCGSDPPQLLNLGTVVILPKVDDFPFYIYEEGATHRFVME
jgi:hypothetical protein